MYTLTLRFAVLALTLGPLAQVRAQVDVGEASQPAVRLINPDGIEPVGFYRASSGRIEILNADRQPVTAINSYGVSPATQVYVVPQAERGVPEYMEYAMVLNTGVSSSRLIVVDDRGTVVRDHREPNAQRLEPMQGGRLVVEHFPSHSFGEGQLVITALESADTLLDVTGRKLARVSIDGRDYYKVYAAQTVTIHDLDRGVVAVVDKDLDQDGLANAVRTETGTLGSLTASADRSAAMAVDADAPPSGDADGASAYYAATDLSVGAAPSDEPFADEVGRGIADAPAYSNLAAAPLPSDDDAPAASPEPSPPIDESTAGVGSGAPPASPRAESLPVEPLPAEASSTPRVSRREPVAEPAAEAEDGVAAAARAALAEPVPPVRPAPEPAVRPARAAIAPAEEGEEVFVVRRRLLPGTDDTYLIVIMDLEGGVVSTSTMDRTAALALPGTEPRSLPPSRTEDAPAEGAATEDALAGETPSDGDDRLPSAERDTPRRTLRSAEADELMPDVLFAPTTVSSSGSVKYRGGLAAELLICDEEGKTVRNVGAVSPGQEVAIDDLPPVEHFFVVLSQGDVMGVTAISVVD